MKIVKIIFSIMFAFAVVLSPKSLRAHQITLNVCFDKKKLTIGDDINKSNFISLNYEGGAFCGAIGAPKLPCKFITIMVPNTAKDFKVTCNGQYVEEILNKEIVPNQKPVLASIHNLGQIQCDSAVYRSNRWIPEYQAKVVNDGFFMGDKHLITLAVCPVQYNPLKRTLRFYSDINISIDYNNDANINRAITRKSANISETESEMIIENQFQVFKDTQTENSQSRMIKEKASVSVDNLEAYDYTIITSNVLENSFKKILAWKRQKGYSAGVITVDDIINNPRYALGDTISWEALNDDAGKIRAYLADAFTNGGTNHHYVLLAGNAPNVPIRYAATQLGLEYPLGPTNDSTRLTPTDLYFSDLNSSWYNDGFSATISDYNEPYNEIDYYPECYVGRLLCSNPDEINNYTEKLLRYEKNPGNGDTSYLTRALFMQSYQFDNEVDSVYSHLNFPVDSTNFREYSTLYPNGTDIINDINSTNYGILDFHGHGAPNAIQVNFGYYPDNAGSGAAIYSTNLDKDSNFYPETGNSLSDLTNTNYPGIVYATSCTNMPFDRVQSPNIYYNLGESYTLGNGYGGVSYLGNTREGYIDGRNVFGPLYPDCNGSISVNLETAFWDVISSGIYNIGKAEALSKTPPVSYMLSTENQFGYHIRMTHNLLGDPEMELWTATPSLYNGIMVNRYDDRIVVSGNIPSGCKIGYTDNECNSGIVNCTSTPTTINNISPNSCITLYQHNYIPYIAPLLIQNDTIINSQYVFASSVSIGNNIDNNRASGNVVFQANNYEIEATGNVSIRGGVVIGKSLGLGNKRLTINTPGSVSMGGVTIKRNGILSINCSSLNILTKFVIEKGGKLILNGNVVNL